MPATFEDLPLDLLPFILEPLVKRADLSRCAQVSREWCRTAQPLLYGSIRLWGKDLAIVTKLFATLEASEHLCSLIHRLEVRVYPLSMFVEEQRAQERQACAVLRQCRNLRSLLWTRKGALTDSVWEAIKTLEKLSRIEINAHTSLSPGSWSANHLLGLPPLTAVSLILPDRAVAEVLPAFLGQHDLHELTLLCRESNVINDRIITACIPHLKSIRSLSLAGCARLTGAPLIALLPHLPHLRHLALEATQIHPSAFPAFAPHLRGLITLKLTHPGPHSAALPSFFPSLAELLKSTKRLESFTLYHSGAAQTGTREWPVMDSRFLEEVVEHVGPSLQKFECSNVLMCLADAETVALGAPELRDFVVHLGHDLNSTSLERLSVALSSLHHLKTLHMLSQATEVSEDDLLELASSASTTLQQIGYRNRVWHVVRKYRIAGPNEDLQSVKPKVRLVEGSHAFGAFIRNTYGAEEAPDTDSEEEED